MKILGLSRPKKSEGLIIEGLMSHDEFRQLNGHLCKLLVLPSTRLDIDASYTKTGSRHNAAKYLLVPVKLRRQFTLDEYDFSDLKCGAVEGDGKVFLIYEVPKRFPGASAERSGAEKAKSDK